MLSLLSLILVHPAYSPTSPPIPQKGAPANTSPPTTPTPVFWSGRYNGVSVAPNAVQCTTKIPGGAATLGMDMCVLGGFTMPNTSTTDAYALWAYASELWAERVKGDAYTVVGDALVTTVWFDDEFPALRANPDVKVIISLDPGTCQEKCYWHCPNPSDCHGLKPCVIDTVDS